MKMLPVYTGNHGRNHSRLEETFRLLVNVDFLTPGSQTFTHIFSHKKYSHFMNTKLIIPESWEK